MERACNRCGCCVCALDFDQGNLKLARSDVMWHCTGMMCHNAVAVTSGVASLHASNRPTSEPGSVLENGWAHCLRAHENGVVHWWTESTAHDAARKDRSHKTYSSTHLPSYNAHCLLSNVNRPLCQMTKVSLNCFGQKKLIFIALVSTQVSITT
jgi:hypothetical protein